MAAIKKPLFLLLMVSSLCIIGCRKKEAVVPEKKISVQPIDTLITQISILVPQDTATYIQKMTSFVQAGGEDPLKTTIFNRKEITIPPASDIIKASAQAAAEEIAPKGGPKKATVSYLKLDNGHAYVVLNIDRDHWAGSSVSLAIIHPIVERTLLQFPQVQAVVFDYAPGDKKTQ